MEGQQTPFAIVSHNDVMALSAILRFYERYRWCSPLPSSINQKDVDITLLFVKLAFLPMGKAAFLTEDDIGCLQSAFRLFTSEVRQKIPPSESRDGLLVSCGQFQEVLTTFMTTPPSRTEKLTKETIE